MTALKLVQSIRAIRNRCGFTQEQVMAQMQVLAVSLSRPSYVKIEGNKQNIRISNRLALQSKGRVKGVSNLLFAGK